jgi:hypothetical protein
MTNPFPCERLILSAVFFCLIIFLGRSSFATNGSQEPVQRQRPSADGLRGVLSEQVLQSPVRSKNHRLRFSPDGKFLLHQSDSGFAVFLLPSLKPILLVSAENIYEVRFSRDSRSLVVVSFALRTGRWRLPDGTREAQGEIEIPGGCLAGELSPAGESLACLTTDFGMHFFDVASGEERFGDKYKPGSYGAMVYAATVAPISLLNENIYARPIGFRGMSSHGVFANRGLHFRTIAFSPDGDTAIVANSTGGSSWSVSTKRKSELSSSFWSRGLCFLDNDRVLNLRAESPEIFSLKTGKLLVKLPFEAVSVVPATDAQYLMVHGGNERSPIRLFDLESNKFVDVPETIALDVREGSLATISSGGELSLFHLGEKIPFTSTLVPLEPLPSQVFVAASPDLDLLSLGFGGAAALFRVSTGARVVTLDVSKDSGVPDSSSAYFVIPPKDKNPQTILRADGATGTLSQAWKSETHLYRLSSAVAFEYDLEDSIRRNIPVMLPSGGMPYQLMAHELGTGHVLWRKSFHSAQAVPFPDPQGKRIVLGWEAKSDGAHDAAKRCPQVLPLFRSTKLNDKDTFFEVLDAATAATVGGVLVQSGSGPDSFDSVFSAGQSLVISKDEGRSVLYSMQNGEVKARVNGLFPAASTESELLSLVENGGRLALYDLRTGVKLEQQQFPEEIAYTHFSNDGRRLLVLTRGQRAYIMDMSEALKVRSAIQ